MPGELERHEHCDLAEPVRDEVMDVGPDDAVCHLEPLRPAQGHVLADGRDRMRDGIRDRAAARIGGGLERFDVIALFEGDVGDLAHEVLEALVASDEIGLRIHLDHDAVIAAMGERDEAFGRHATGFLRGLGEAFLAQPVDRGLDPALGLVQRRLAIHHARAGLVAKLLDHGGGNHCHRTLALLFKSNDDGAAGFRQRDDPQLDDFPSVVMTGRGPVINACLRTENIRMARAGPARTRSTR